MENTYIISDYSNWLNPIIEGLKISECVLSYEELSEDWQFDEWIKRNIKVNTKCLIIPVELGENRLNSLQGLRVAMHLRLMQSELRYLPIVFISNREDWQIRQMQRDSFDKDHLDYLIGTNGTDFLAPNIAEIKAVLENIKPLTKENYAESFYSNTHILPLEEEGGKHSLANIWGVLRLNEVLNLNAITDTSLMNRTKELYFKYLRAFHNEESKGDSDNTKNNIEESKEVSDDAKNNLIECGEIKDENGVITSNQKRILLIDDEAEKGWASVLKAIFKKTDFQYINFQNRSFEVAEKEAKEKIINEDWDLILLDLRLNPKLEDLPNKLLKTKDYSGAMLLEFIKNYNKGIQVIMLTASDKAWNMKKLLDLGADGYYIKESPEFNFSSEFTVESYKNLVDEVDSCFNKDFAKKLFKMNESIENRLKIENNILGNRSLKRGTVKLIKDVYLKQAFDAAYKVSSKNQEFALYSFLEYYKVVEVLGKELIDESTTEYFIKRKPSPIGFIIKSPLKCMITPITIQPGKKIFVEGYEIQDYSPKDDSNFYVKPSSSLRFSALMLLRFGFNKEDVKDFMALNNLRNTVVAHSADNPNAEITIENVIKLAEILEKAFAKL